MKRYLNLFFVATGFTFLMASCACSGIDCENGGTCNDGKCDCLKGYYGDNCELKDFCDLNEVICVYGDCVDGVCECTNGYEKADCSVAARDKFLGTYSIKEACDPLDTVVGYSMAITQDIQNPANMYLSNVFNDEQFPINGFFSKIKAVPTPNTNKFKIPNQDPDANGKFISGDGTLVVLDSATTQITINYTATMKNGKSYTCQLDATLNQ